MEDGTVIDRVIVTCTGPKARPHKAFPFPFERASDGVWTSFTHEVLGDPDGGQADIRADLEGGAHPARFQGHHLVTGVDRREHSRVRGGVRGTRSGYELTCPRHTRPTEGVYAFRDAVLQQALEGLARNGIAEINVNDLLDVARRVQAKR
jgi:hypothetical protein